MNRKWKETIVDRIISEFPENYWIGPKHPLWLDRVRIEIEKIMEYIKFLRKRNNEPWFKLYPEKDPGDNFQIWKGYLTIPKHTPQIKFDIRVILSSEYPVVPPRCFAESTILDYTGKLYPKNDWREKEKKFVMICHDHLSKTKSWNRRLGIVHFFMRQIWVWWAAQQNQIIKEFKNSNQ
jgi:hypothetical protein